MKKENNGSTATKEEKKEIVNKNKSKKGLFKSELIKSLVEKIKKPKSDKAKDSKSEDEIKDSNAISLSDILSDINNMSKQDIDNICEDINSMKIKVGIDSKAIELLSDLKENENAKKLLQNLNISMDIDVKSISEFRKSDFDTVKSMGCKIGKVYVNSGWDEAAEKGYTADKYEKIVTNAEKMLQKAIGGLPKTASQKDKFMAIYNAVLKAEHYDYSALSKNSPNKYTSRNLEGFFLQGKSVCAGTADALKNLCECAGIEMEYVQGMAKSKHEHQQSYHAWVKAKIDGQWYNADPTWDANKVGKKYEFCLKSDKDFYGHKEDKEYNPTYRRDRYSQTHRRTGETRTYKSANISIDRTELEEYYDTDFDKKEINIEKVSQSALKYATKHYQPVSSVPNIQLTFKQKLAEFLSKRKHLKNVSFIKNFIEKNKFTHTKTENTGSKMPNKTVKELFSNQDCIQKVPKDVSERYIKNYNKQNKGYTPKSSKENIHTR
ncbi:MAG: hypothetical protein J6K42_02180 [Clostridia bacterium]|nr:hypothetical protein [Clostridia bacterium]